MTESNGKLQPELDPANPAVIHTINRLARFYLRGSQLQGLFAEDDIQQIVLMDLLKSNTKNVVHPKSYLRAMVRNAVIKYLKDMDYQNEIRFIENLEFEADKYLAKTPAQEENPDINILLSEIWEKLHGNDRHILQLLILGHSSREIARIMTITDVAARQRVSRLKHRLRKLVFADINEVK